MNQAIIFTDNEHYNNALQQIEFQAQSQGALISCIISLANVKKLNEQTESLDQSLSNIDVNNMNEEQALALFEHVRFDIEDLAEAMINQQAFSDDEKIYLSPY